ncbi:hypothetical protein UFOVP124_2 [uncultured Caudovirales phage]|uniref:Uncharacterized protein n=1 Tax=uncultured Caudovirales phage TaxID=2100421 RepID=A0A6J5LBA1_9CAUD|nr:hypothetical protein UFOVP124_2 [uncultured Caudovirales phage]
MGDSYGSHVLHSLQKFINTQNSYIAEHDEKLKMLEHRLTALEAQQAPAQVPAVTVQAENAALREQCERADGGVILGINPHQ